MLAHESAVVLDLGPQFQNLESVVDELNRRSNGVAATQVGGELRVALVRPAELGGIPAYYGPRPSFRATATRSGEGLRLSGAVNLSPLPLLFNIGGGVAAVLAATAGGLVLLAGDSSGIIAIIFGALAEVGILAGTTLMMKLARGDEEALRDAITGLNHQSGLTTPGT